MMLPRNAIVAWPCTRRHHHHARDSRIIRPGDELLRQRAHHRVRHRIERVRTVENDDASRAAALKQNVGRRIQTTSRPRRPERTPVRIDRERAFLDWHCIIRTTMSSDPLSPFAR